MSLVEKLSSLKKGQIITGRWEGNRYKILKHIGSGGTGTVYLVEDKTGSLKALKVSSDLFGLTGEHRTLIFLRSIGELQSLGVIPVVFEIDDFQIDSQVYHFIVMEYCQGENLIKFKGKLSIKNAAIVGRKVAAFLDCLHRVGFIFGDLKPANVIYNFKTGQTYVVDYGSVTVKGGRLRQFTPGYDRATWLAGARVADESYDMFSLGMLLAVLILGNVSRNRCEHPVKMAEKIPGRISNSVMREAVRKALTQNALTCSDIFSDLSGVAFECGLLEKSIHGVNSILINVAMLTSAVTFIMSLIYFYQSW